MDWFAVNMNFVVKISMTAVTFIIYKIAHVKIGHIKQPSWTMTIQVSFISNKLHRVHFKSQHKRNEVDKFVYKTEIPC